MESVLLLFDKDHPCWTQDLVESIGEDPETLKTLHKKGMVLEENGIYRLTTAGSEAYRQAAKLCFYHIPPGEKPVSPDRAVERNRLEHLLDHAFLGRWGIKEFRPGAKLAYVPALSGKQIFNNTQENLTWTYEADPVVGELLERYPLPTGPDITPPNLDEFENWLREKACSYGNLELDLLFLHHYDSEHFKNLAPQPNDRLRLYHTDRFYFQLVQDTVPDLATLLEDIGKFHLFLSTQRRIFLPWFFNRDSTNYDSVNWWFWVTKTEDGLAKLKALVDPLSEALVAPALPLQLFGISIEALKQVKEKREYHWDLFEEIAIPLSRRL